MKKYKYTISRNGVILKQGTLEGTGDAELAIHHVKTLHHLTRIKKNGFIVWALDNEPVSLSIFCPQ